MFRGLVGCGSSVQGFCQGVVVVWQGETRVQGLLVILQGVWQGWRLALWVAVTCDPRRMTRPNTHLGPTTPSPLPQPFSDSPLPPLPHARSPRSGTSKGPRMTHKLFQNTLTFLMIFSSSLFFFCHLLAVYFSHFDCLSLLFHLNNFTDRTLFLPISIFSFFSIFFYNLIVWHCLFSSP